MATKYVSALDGGQMDSALMDMATHTSEAWAVGTRNGQAVASSDVTYHNNAKYYSDKVSTDTQRAEDAAARAEAAVPAGTAGAVFFNTAQSLTTAQQMQAKANISAGGTNPNLLDNPWFTINQRNFTSGSIDVQEYTRDRWKNARVSSVVYNNNGTLTYAWNGNASGAFLSQYAMPEIAPFLVGKTVTVSAYVEGVLYSKSFTLPSSSNVEYLLGDGLNIVVINQISTNRGFEFQFRHQSGTGKTIGPVKCELGSVSTLANDAPPDYGTELAKCQRYFLRVMSYGTHSPIAFGYGSNSTTCRVLLPTPTTMRAIPTVTMTGSFLLFGNGSTIAVTSLGAYFTRANGVALLATVASGVSSNITYCLAGNQTDDYIDLSADL